MVRLHWRRLPKDSPNGTPSPQLIHDDVIHDSLEAIADHIEQNNLQADPLTKKKFNLFVGASVGPEVEDRWARLDMIARRYPHQVGKDISKGINAGRIDFADKHLSSAFLISLSFISH